MWSQDQEEVILVSYFFNLTASANCFFFKLAALNKQKFNQNNHNIYVIIYRTIIFNF